MADTTQRIEIVFEAKDRASGVLGSIAGGLGGIGQVAAGILSANIFSRLSSGILDIGKASITAAANMETNRVAMTTLLGSAELAQDMLINLQKLAKTTPFSFESAVDGAKRLMAMGVAAQDVEKNLRMIGNAVAAVGGGSEVFDRMVYNLGQVQAQGRATTMDLRQFAMAGIPIYDALSEAIGVTSAQLGEMVEKGEIGYDQLVAGLQAYYGEGAKFGNMMEEQSKTFSGVMANLKDAWSITLQQFAEKSGLLEAVKTVAETMMRALSELPGIMERIANHPFFALLKEHLAVLWDRIQQLAVVIVEALGISIDEVDNKAATFVERFGIGMVAAIDLVVQGITKLVEWLIVNKDTIIAVVEAVAAFIVFIVKATFEISKFVYTVAQAWSQFTISATNAIITVINWINTLINAINRIPGVEMNYIGQTPKKQFGGLAGGMTLVGEAGPELVRMPAGSHVYSAEHTKLMGNAGGGVTVNFNGDLLLDSESRIDQLVERIEMALGNNTNLGLRGV